MVGDIMRKLKKKTIEECKKQLVAIKNEYDYILKRKSDYSNGGEMIDMATKEQLIHSSSTFSVSNKGKCHASIFS